MVGNQAEHEDVVAVAPTKLDIAAEGIETLGAEETIAVSGEDGLLDDGSATVPVDATAVDTIEQEEEAAALLIEEAAIEEQAPIVAGELVDATVEKDDDAVVEEVAINTVKEEEEKATVAEENDPLSTVEADSHVPEEELEYVEPIERRGSSTTAPITSLPIRAATPQEESDDVVSDIEVLTATDGGSDTPLDVELEDSAIDFYQRPADEQLPSGEESKSETVQEEKSEEALRGALTAQALAAGGLEVEAEDFMEQPLALEDPVEQKSQENSEDGDRYVTAAESFGNKPLMDNLTIHVSKLEAARTAALAAPEARKSARDLSARLNEEPVQPLELKPHLSALERAKAEALANPEPRLAARSRASSSTMDADSTLPSLDALPIHKSRLEREKEAAVAAAAKEQEQAGNGGLRSRLQAPVASGFPPLGAFPVHKSRLEREKEEAAARKAAESSNLLSPRQKTALMRERAAAERVVGLTSPRLETVK